MIKHKLFDKQTRKFQNCYEKMNATISNRLSLLIASVFLELTYKKAQNVAKLHRYSSTKLVRRFMSFFCDKPQLKMREINPFPCVLSYFPRRFKALFPGHKHPIYSLQNGTSPAVKHHASPVPRTTAKFGTRNLVPCKV